MQTRNPWLWFGISAIIVLFLYAPACFSPFVYDDVSQVAENGNLSSWSIWWTSSVAFDSDYLPFPGRFYRPLFWTSLAIDHTLFGLNPAGYHFTNLLLHWLCGLLLFRLLSEFQPRIAWAASILWLVLPVHAEVVAWVSGRAMALSALGVLAGLCFPRFVLPLQLAALMAHEGGLVLAPLSYLLRGRSVALQAVVAGAVYGLGRILVTPSTFSFHPDQLLRGPLALWRTLQWTLFPLRQSVERSSEWSGAAPWEIVLGWALLAATLWASRRYRLLLWSPLALIPFSGLFPLYQGFAERYCYLASIGVVCLLMSLSIRWQKTARNIVLILIPILAIRTAVRVQDWRDEKTLYESSLRASPRSHVLRYNLGVLAADGGEARQWYESALELNPGYQAARVNLANLLQRDGDVAGARKLYAETLAADPQRVDALVNFGNLEQRQGRTSEAEQLYRRALQVDPAHQTAQLNLAALLLGNGRTEEAGRLLRNLLSVNPNNAQAHANLGALYFETGQLQEARTHLERAASLLPDNGSAWFNLGVLYRSLGQPSQAVECFRRALALNPQHSGAVEQLAQMK